MCLIASPKLTEKDKKDIEAGYDERNIVERALTQGLKIQTSDADVIRVKNLTWMIANNKLDIRIARPTSWVGEGIYHEKIGLFFDSTDEATSNIVAFSGSLNETAEGLLSNYESIDVSVSWERGEREILRVENHVKHFNAMWNGAEEGLEMLEFPEAVRRQIIELYAPEYPEQEPGKRRKPYPFQQTAVDRWRDAGGRGILSMATGSGKTFTALKCLETCPQPLISVIIVPYSDLVKQWEDEIDLQYPRSCRVRKVYSEETNWPTQIEHLVGAFSSSVISDLKRNFIVCTIQTASRDKLRELLSNIPIENLAVVIDEVHHSGADEFSKVFDMDAKYRLGLSATPERAWDEEGNQRIFDYFGPVVYEYDISTAIQDGILCRYQYFIHPVALTLPEREEFQGISRRITIITARAKNKYPELRSKPIPEILQYLDQIGDSLAPELRSLYLRRVNIVKKASSKGDALRVIIRDSKLGRCLVYCNDLEHLTECTRIILDEGYDATEYSSKIDTGTRARLRETFAKETEGTQFMVAVRCLDEGVDIPACDSAILISSSRSTREFIQRRGRVLRRHPTKKSATIHDIVVLPFTNPDEAYGLTSSEYNFVETELARIEQFAKNADNKEQIDLSRIRQLYRLA